MQKGEMWLSYFETHSHSSYSNLRLYDSINRLEEMIEYANEIGLKGICLTDHEALSGHLKFINTYKKLKEKGVIAKDFKIGLGNEIYLVMEDNLEELKTNIANRNPETKFYHFLLLAKNAEGHKQLRKLSSLAWENMFVSHGQTRVPTFKNNLKQIVQKGDVIATTACIGGFLGQTILRIHRAESENEANKYRRQLADFLTFCIDVFGEDNFYMEIQPSSHEEQIIVNKAIVELSKQTGIKYTIATDGHYLKKEDRHAHRVYLKAQDGEREVDEFYETTYIMSEDEIKEYLLTHLTEEEIQAGFDATMDIYHKIEFYDLARPTVVPLPPIPEYEFQHILAPVYDQYEYIKKFAYSEHEADRYLLYLAQEGLIEKIVKKRKADKEYFHKCLDRLNTELRELWLISDRINQRVSAYYVLTKDVVDLMWEAGDSLVGVARGSGAGYLLNFLLGITQLNPLDYNLPHFRHLTAERPELPDKLLSSTLAIA